MNASKALRALENIAEEIIQERDLWTVNTHWRCDLWTMAWDRSISTSARILALECFRAYRHLPLFRN